MASDNSNSSRATQADDDHMIGSKSIFTPEFQKRLFACFTPSEVYALEKAIMMPILANEAKDRLEAQIEELRAKQDFADACHYMFFSFDRAAEVQHG